MENENLTFLNTTIERLKKANSSLEKSLIATQNQTIEVKRNEISDKYQNIFCPLFLPFSFIFIA